MTEISWASIKEAFTGFDNKDEILKTLQGALGLQQYDSWTPSLKGMEPNPEFACYVKEKGNLVAIIKKIDDADSNLSSLEYEIMSDDKIYCAAHVHWTDDGLAIKLCDFALDYLDEHGAGKEPEEE